MPDDAVYVFCNMTGGGQSCVFPDMHASKMPNIPWRKNGATATWFSKLRGGFKVGAGDWGRAEPRRVVDMTAF